MSRGEAELGVEELAELIQDTPEHIMAMEAGSIRVPSLALARISRIVDKPLSWFFEGLPGQDVFESDSETKRSV